MCVIGAGSAGLCVALQLAREGFDVLVLDRAGHLGAGETGLSSAHLSDAIDDGFDFLEQRHGREGAALAYRSHHSAISWIETFATQTDIDFGFQRVDGYLVSHDGTTRRLEQEFEAMRRLDIAQSVSVIEALQYGAGLPRPALRFAKQAQIDPQRYVDAIGRAFRQLGGRIATQASVDGVSSNPLTVHLGDGREIRCERVVIATNAPGLAGAALQTKLPAYRSYAIALEVPQGLVPPVVLWDTDEPYHYARVHQPLDDAPALFVVGGEDHKTGQETDGEQRWQALEEWARERFPQAGALRHRWSGQILEPPDGLAYIGQTGSDPGVHVVTGDSGHGLTHGAIAGMLLTALFLERESPWAELYNPQRLPIQAIGDYARENLNAIGQYKDWFGGHNGVLQDLRRGSGMVINKGVHHLAVYCDPRGNRHVRSAVCPHLGGIVRWNPAEQSWDCPCHGSRFDPFGRVLDGPANKDLAPSGVEEEKFPMPLERASDAS